MPRAQRKGKAKAVEPVEEPVEVVEESVPEEAEVAPQAETSPEAGGMEVDEQPSSSKITLDERQAKMEQLRLKMVSTYISLTIFFWTRFSGFITKIAIIVTS